MSDLNRKIVYADDVKKEIDEWLDCVGDVVIGKHLSYYGELLGCIEDAPSVTDTNVGSKWIPCSERMPEERESIFKKAKGTDKWDPAMFEGISDDVNVTVEFEDGTRTTKTSHTLDGVWKCEKDYGIKMKVIAWQPLPEPYKGE